MNTLGIVDVWIDNVPKIDANTITTTTTDKLVPIQGKMITAKLEIDAHTAVTMDDVALKNKVLNMLLNELLAAKCVEFTKQQEVDKNTIIIRARIYATPDEEVRLIRQASTLPTSPSSVTHNQDGTGFVVFNSAGDIGIGSVTKWSNPMAKANHD